MAWDIRLRAKLRGDTLMAQAKSRSVRSVRVRLALWNVGILALVLLVFGVVIQYRVKSLALAGIDHRLNNFANNMRRAAATDLYFPYPPPARSR